MTNKKISDLPATSGLLSTHLIELESAASLSEKATLAQLEALIGPQLLPFNHGGGIDPTVASAVAGVPALILVPAFCHSPRQINSLYFSIVASLASLQAIPCIYGGTDPTTATPNATGAALAASGPAVACATGNKIYKCDLSSPFIPTSGLWYWVGFSVFGASGNTTWGALGNNRREVFASGTFNPVPATLPAMTAGTNNNTPYWTN